MPASSLSGPVSAGEIRDRAIRLWGDPNTRMSTRRDLRFGKKGSLSVVLIGDKAGVWFDHEAQTGGTLLTDEEIKHQRPTTYQPRTRFPESESREYLMKTLQNQQSVAGTPTDFYLQSRGITAWPHSIRHCTRPNALCAIAQTTEGKILACQIVYLTQDGRKQPRADGVQKRTYTACENWHTVAAVRMPGTDRRARPIICEGVETGLSVWNAFGGRRLVLSSLGNAGFGDLRLKAKRITIARDGDAEGSKADKQVLRSIERRTELPAKWRQDHVAVAKPLIEGDDFNDVLRREGAFAVRAIIEQAERA